MSTQPVVVQYCEFFLKQEMFHIYRQITALRTWQPQILFEHREEVDRFPFDPTALTAVQKPRTYELERVWNKLLRRPRNSITNGEARLISQEITRLNGKVLHVYFGHVANKLLPLLRRAPVPVIVSYHGADAGGRLNRPDSRAQSQEVFSLARLVLARSASMARRLIEGGCPPEKIRIHRTGVPIEQFEFIQRPAPKDGAWRLFQACRLIPKKGLHTTITAFAEFARTFPRATLEIAGSGVLLPDLKALAETHGVADKVRFPGFLAKADLLARYAEAHLFVHPSEVGRDGNIEGVPNSMLEAMATGLPVAATRHEGIPEAVEDGVSGLLVAEKDAAGLAAALKRLASDPILYASIALAGRAAVVRGFEQRQQAEVLEACYREAAGR